MEQILFLVLVAVVGLVRWIAQAAENKRNAEAEKRAGAPTNTTATSPRAPADSEEERVRKFFEALGVPTTSAPPPPVVPREVAPKPPPLKRKILPVDPFPKPRGGLFPPVVLPAPPIVPATPPPIPEFSPLPMRETTMLAQPPVAPPQRDIRVSPEFDVQDFDSEKADGERGQIAGQTWAARLATQQGLRDAIVLREIFGPPRSMQPLHAKAMP